MDFDERWVYIERSYDIDPDFEDEDEELELEECKNCEYFQTHNNCTFCPHC